MVNFGFFISKLILKLFRPALRNCKIDKSSKIGSGCNCIKTTVGRYSYMGNNCVVVNTKIGSFCSIASNCSIGGGAHPTDKFSTSPIFYSGKNIFRKNFSHINYNAEKKVEIGNDVWIGEKVFIKDGITIGNGAVIGALSVVTHNVPPYAIVGGVPARIIRYRFDQDTINTLEQLQWWNFDDTKLMQFTEILEKNAINKTTIESTIAKI